MFVSTKNAYSTYIKNDRCVALKFMLTKSLYLDETTSHSASHPKLFDTMTTLSPTLSDDEAVLKLKQTRHFVDDN